MANIQIHNGPSNIIEISYKPDTRMFNLVLKEDNINNKMIPLKELEILEIATDENVKSMNQS